MTPEFVRQLPTRDQAIFDGFDAENGRALFRYLYGQRGDDQCSRPRSMKTRAIGLYDPFCDRSRYPLGVLWQTGPYSCCDHGCAYCYGRSYLARFPGGGTVKPRYLEAVRRDLDDLQRLGVPPRHLSMANSSDMLQSRLERGHRMALALFEMLAERKELFSSFGVLTKHPGILLDDRRYLAALGSLDAELQVSICFWRDNAAAEFEPGAPSPSARRAAVERLATEGLRVALRLDPLFPRGVAGCREIQSRCDDVEPLIDWAAAVPVSYVITSAAKLPFRRNREEGFHRALVAGFPVVRRAYRRMLPKVESGLLSEVRELGSRRGLTVEHCFANIVRRSDVGRVGPREGGHSRMTS